MIALIGITIDRNVTSRSRNAIVSTKPNTIGACCDRLSVASIDSAAEPPTSTVQSRATSAAPAADGVGGPRRPGTGATIAGWNETA